jgi:glucokinase
MDGLIIGVDLGGTNIRAALADETGKILRHAGRPTAAHEGRASVLARIVATIREAAGSDLSNVRGIGIGAPGPLDPWKGIVHEAPNLPGWFNVPLRDIVQTEFGIRTFVGNDANLAALAEHRFGAGRGANDLIYITISTGIGGGILIDGKLLLGADGFAGEVGHISVEPNGPQCNCGNVGCLEALAAGPAIARQAVERIQAGAASRITELVASDLSQVTAATVDRAAREGDPLAVEIFQRAGFYLGIGLVNLIHIFNPRLFVVGGGVSKAGDLIFKPAWAVVEERAMPSMKRDVHLKLAELGDDVGVLGGVALVLAS